MPIYEYRCEECGATFEKLVRSMSGQVTVECPECHSAQCRKSISLFGTRSSGSSLGASSMASCAPSG
ncbi:MAG TPA: zinc ribbon domain-containing protein [Chloroflexi bacterium]|jgi:putative FmdB family regulatory protein|nr:zinc ribbon domain-containing protein [Chloroflexota bacterium]